MSTYYTYFPTVLYDGHSLTDITKRINLSGTWLADEKLYYRYQIQDHDKIEHLALKYYGNESYHWILMLTNNMFDSNYDFPMNDRVFKKYIEDKYKDSKSIKLIRILDHGYNYNDGIYEEVPLIIINQEQLSTVGANATVDLIVAGNTVSNIQISSGGFDYDANTILTIDTNIDGLQNGYGFTGKISSYLSGFEYALTTPDPIYRYQKQITITSDLDVPQVDTYVIDKESFENLYDIYPSGIKTFNIDGQMVNYEVTRRTPEVTIYEREYEQNEAKRTIRILKKKYLEQAVQFIHSLV